jgi:hypothetical protein
MKKFVAFTVATLFATGASIAAAQCATCSGNQAPVFSQAQPVYSAPATPVYTAPAPPVYSAPVYSQPVYATPSAPVYSQPIVSTPAPVYNGSSCCGCGSSEAVSSGEVISGDATFTSYGDSTTLAVGSVINGETVVSVGESTIVGTTDPGEGSEESNVIDGDVEAGAGNGEVVAPPADDSTPQPEDAMEKKEEMTEGDA